MTKTYDTFGDGRASARMVEDYAAVTPGSVVIAVVKDEGS